MVLDRPRRTGFFEAYLYYYYYGVVDAIYQVSLGNLVDLTGLEVLDERIFARILVTSSKYY